LQCFEGEIREGKRLMGKPKHGSDEDVGMGLNEIDGRKRNGLMWLRIWTKGRTVVKKVMNVRFP
jgi:hypothetical protein